MEILAALLYGVGFGLTFGFTIWDEEWYQSLAMAVIWPAILCVLIPQLIWHAHKKKDRNP